MEKVALFPGSFDPFTLGHQSVVNRALTIFDKVVVGIGVNSRKQYLFSVEDRVKFINEVFVNQSSKVEVVSYSGLTVDYCNSNKISFIIRGIRNSRDFLFENEIAGMNLTLNADIETILLASYPEHSMINANIVREIYRNGGDVSEFLPANTALPKLPG